YDHAMSEKADYIFQTDSDGQTLPSEFADFWKIRAEHDMVIGNRAGRQDGSSRVFVTKTLKAVIRLCFHVSVTDANTPFRLMKAETLKKYRHYIPDGFNLSNVLISVIYAKKKLSVKYLPITFRPRQGGKNSINMKSIFKIGRQALSDFVQINKTLKE
nr:glycosyltransferase family 2 protein [Lachnospiraceae bacterium]